MFRFDVTLEYPTRDIVTVSAKDELEAEDYAIEVIAKKFPDLNKDAIDIIEVKELENA